MIGSLNLVTFLEFSIKIPVFIYRKSGGINCRKEGNGPADAPDDNDGEDDYDLGDPEYKHKFEVKVQIAFLTNTPPSTNKQF